MKRALLTAVLLAALAAAGLLGLARADDDEMKATDLTPDQALERLMKGNEDYAAHHMKHGHLDDRRLKEVAKSQHPFATIITCADSRVTPEFIFDQGLGDLFVIRVAGNVTDDVVLGSIEYAASHLHTPIVMVLGHERCGAVGAAVEGVVEAGHLFALVSRILPAVRRAKEAGGDVLDGAVRQNVKLQVENIAGSEPVLAELVRAKKIRVVGARYDLDDGKVTLDPWTVK